MIGGLAGKVAVVTGGASGIGEACCNLLEASGASVHVADLTGRPAVDVTDRASLDELAAGLERLHAFINAPRGPTENPPGHQLPPADLSRNVQGNQLLLPHPP